MVKVFWSSLLVLIVDRITKLLTTGIENIPILPFFNLVYVENSGAAFGSFSSATTMLIIITFAVLYAIFHYREKLLEISPLATGLIVGGAIGNLFDRIIHGHVIDFLDFYVGNYHWPAFNIADSALVIGVILLYMKSRQS